MGYYINAQPSKEVWLDENGVLIAVADVMKWDFTGDSLPVCLVDNGWMTAAGIAFDSPERDEFMRPDGRPKQWYSVTREKLRPFYG